MRVFTNPKKQKETFKSPLTDEDAANICAKLDNDFARDLAEKFFKVTKVSLGEKKRRAKLITETQIFWLHKLANEKNKVT